MGLRVVEWVYFCLWVYALLNGFMGLFVYGVICFCLEFSAGTTSEGRAATETASGEAASGAVSSSGDVDTCLLWDGEWFL